MPGSPDRAARETNVYSSALIGSRMGVISSCLERRASSDGFALRNWIAQGPRFRDGAVAPERVFGGGTSAWRTARAAAIGEAVERLCLADRAMEPLPLAALGDLPDAPDAASLTFFLPEQYAAADFPIRAPDFSRPLAWCRGWALVADRPGILPASLIHMPYRLRAGEAVLSDPSSVGTASARDLGLAAARAILELIERDAWTMAWEARVPAPPVAEASLLATPSARTSRHVCDGAGLRLRGFDLTNDVGIPVMLALAESDQAPPALAIGTAAGLDAGEALDRAVAEAVTSWRSTAYLYRASAQPESDPLPRGRDIFSRTALFYARPENRRHLDFLTGSSLPPVAPSTGPARRDGDDLATIGARLRLGGHEVVLYDLTSEDVARYGLHVVRAVSVTLIRPTLGKLRHLAHPRLLGVPRAMNRVDPGIEPVDLLSFTVPAP